jgi:hypothetical protein
MESYGSLETMRNASKELLSIESYIRVTTESIENVGSNFIRIKRQSISGVGDLKTLEKRRSEKGNGGVKIKTELLKSGVGIVRITVTRC